MKPFERSPLFVIGLALQKDNASALNVAELREQLFGHMDGLTERANKACKQSSSDNQREEVLKEFYPHLRTYVNLRWKDGDYQKKLQEMVTACQALLNTYPATPDRLRPIMDGVFDSERVDDPRQRLAKIITEYRLQRTPDTI